MEKKKLVPKSYTLCDSIHITFSKRKTNYWEQVNCCQGLGIGNIVTLLRGWHKGVLGLMELFCSLAVVIVTVIYIGIKINRTVHKKNPIIL